MPWWGWMVVGCMLLAGEAAVTADFYLALIGLAALTVGLLGLGLEGPLWLQYALFAVLSVGYLVGFRGRLAERLGASGEEPPLLEGEIAIVQEDIAPGATGRAELRGATWIARNRSHETLSSGTRARVEKTEGLVIQIRSEADVAARARHRRKSQLSES